MIETSTEPMILTFDIGTSSVKVALYGRDGSLLDTASRPHSYSTPQPGWAEADPEEWWTGVQMAVRELGARHNLRRVEALSFTGQMHTAVLLDRQGNVIPPTIMWLDRRAERELHDLLAEWPLPPYQLNSTYTLPKLLWLKRNRPELLNAVSTIVWPKDYVRYRCTGVRCTDLTEAGGAALLDWELRQWALDRLHFVGLDARVLPELRPADGDGGPLLPAVAKEWGVDAGAHVIVGMGDVAALFGGAPLRLGRVVCSLGSSSMIFTPLAKGHVVRDTRDRLYVYPFGPCPMLGGVSSTTGAALQWIHRVIGMNIPFEKLIREALEVPPGADGLCFLPYLAGERSPYWNDSLRGGWYGLKLGHDRRHLVRAVMEGVAFSLRHLLDIYAELGVQIREIALAGGGTRTAGWPQIFADVCGRPVVVYAGQETVTRVLYALCASHLGWGQFEPALESTFGAAEHYLPNEAWYSLYEKLYQTYLRLSEFAHIHAEGTRVS